MGTSGMKQHGRSTGSSTSINSHNSSAAILSSAKPKQLHEVWPGKNQPCCGGRVFCGPDTQILVCTFALILIHSGLFFYFTALKIHILVAIFDVLLTALSIAMLCGASFVEAGILPRAPPPTDPHGIPPGDPPTIKVNGQDVKLKYCTTCHIYRPPRAKHCRDCDNCVEEFDHHCPWVSNCVGLRNYRYFVSFVISITILDSYIFLLCVGDLVHETAKKSLMEAITENIASAYLTIFTFLFGWCLCGLSGFHCYLISTNTTTNEELTGYFGGVKPEAKISPVRNFSRLFCRLTPGTKVPLNGQTDEGHFLITQHGVADSARIEINIDNMRPREIPDDCFSRPPSTAQSVLTTLSSGGGSRRPSDTQLTQRT